MGVVVNTAENFRNTESIARVEKKIKKKEKRKKKQKAQCLTLTEGRKPLKNKQLVTKSK